MVDDRLLTYATGGFPPLKELSRVSLRAEQSSRDGTCVPAGSKGTIVAVLSGGKAYMVEFVRPVQAVLTLQARDFSPLRGAFA